mmetsp:Transcript_46768/g.63658  ORF Transcript_46768/g.63658 Transcript_46768/m.63658 type:complete len:89 (-) Transcript_46768:161-427(-)
MKTAMGLTDIDTRVCETTEEMCFSYCSQEKEMWDTFARRCCSTSQDEDESAALPWASYALKTQAVLDAVMMSISKDGAEIPFENEHED